MDRRKKGFTLAELLITVAIISVLVAISIPIFTTQLEKSREAVDLANVRSAYAEVMAAAVSADRTADCFNAANDRWEIDVPLKQKTTDWQTEGDLNIGGVIPSDTMHWTGIPTAGGKCHVSYSETRDVVLNWDINFLPIFDLNASAGNEYNGKNIAQLIRDNNFTRVESSGSTGRSFAKSVQNLLGLSGSDNFSYLITCDKDTGYYRIYISTDYTLKTNTTQTHEIKVTGYLYDVNSNVIIKRGTEQLVPTYINKDKQEKIKDDEYVWE